MILTANPRDQEARRGWKAGRGRKQAEGRTESGRRRGSAKQAQRGAGIFEIPGEAPGDGSGSTLSGYEEQGEEQGEERGIRERDAIYLCSGSEVPCDVGSMPGWITHRMISVFDGLRAYPCLVHFSAHLRSERALEMRQRRAARDVSIFVGK